MVFWITIPLMCKPDVLISRDPYLNSPVTCDVFTPINIDLWKTDTPALQVLYLYN
jgi:hypothetical protein